MSITPTLPPTARDFLAFQRIVIDQASTRQVARELEISQTRVRQVVRRAADWLQENLPKTDELQDAAFLRLAQHIAADRLDRYLRDAESAWQTTRETKYANLVLRLLAAQSKSPSFAGTLEALIADATLGPLPHDDLSAPDHLVASFPPGHAVTRASSLAEPQEDATSSPSNACSPSLPPPPREYPTEPSAIAPTPTPQIPSDNTSTTANAARKAFLAPAQPWEGEAPAHPFSRTANTDDSPVTELTITPQTLTFHPNKPLNRRQRRRLQRLAGKK